MSGVRYEGIEKRFEAFTALHALNLNVPDRTFLALLGPSGCGKTTALRILAGLETPTAGKVLIGDRDVTRLQPRDRDVAMVFQSYALYPHMTIADNIGYPLRIRKVDAAMRAKKTGVRKDAAKHNALDSESVLMPDLEALGDAMQPVGINVPKPAVPVDVTANDDLPDLVASATA